jgi:hypothetical protein
MVTKLVYKTRRSALYMSVVIRLEERLRLLCVLVFCLCVPAVGVFVHNRKLLGVPVIGADTTGD